MSPTKNTPTESESLVTPEQFVASLSEGELNALAALEPGRDEFNDLVFSHFPSERRSWALEHKLATEVHDQLTPSRQPGLTLTDRGRRVIELASERCPEPYAEVSIDELLEHTQRTVDRLMADSPVELIPPEEHIYLPERVGSLFRSIFNREKTTHRA